MTFSAPKKATLNINTTCRCGLTVAAPIEVYEPSYVNALELENSRLREALKEIEDLMPLNERERRRIARDALEGK